MCSIEFAEITPRMYARGRVFIRRRKSRQTMRVAYIVVNQTSTFAARHAVHAMNDDATVPTALNYVFLPVRSKL